MYFVSQPAVGDVGSHLEAKRLFHGVRVRGITARI
jgi:hypothetical protein